MTFEFKYRDFMRVDFPKGWWETPQNRKDLEIRWLDSIPLTLIDTSIDPSLAFTHDERINSQYHGRILMRLVRMAPSQITVGYDRKSFMGADSEGWKPLAQGEFEVRMEFEDFPNIRTVAKSLTYESGIFEQFDEAEEVVKNMKQLMGDSMGKARNDEGQISLSEMMIVAEKLASGKGDEIGIGGVDFASFKGVLKEILRKSDLDKRRLRSLQHSAMREKVKVDSNPEGFDYYVTRDFGDDVFYIFRHYMNFVIRYLKYTWFQYWLKEIPEQDLGYFYLEREVRWESGGSTGIMIPSAYHSLDAPLLSDDFSAVNREKWTKIVNDIRSGNGLPRTTSESTSWGIFSLSIDEIFAGNLETAYVLATVGLEESINEFYERLELNGNNGLKAKWNLKLRKISEKINHFKTNVDYREFGFKDEKIYEQTLNAILEMIQQRNDIVHRKETKISTSGSVVVGRMKRKFIPRSPGERKVLYDRIVAAIRLSQALAELGQGLGFD